MSRTAVENEARTNQNPFIVEGITNYLKQCPPAEGYEIILGVGRGDGPSFEAIIGAESPEVIRPFITFYLEEVPTIREYFRSTGALQLAWEGFLKRQKCDAKLAYENLFGEKK